MLFLCHVFNSGMNMLYYVIMGLFVVIQILIVQYGGGVFDTVPLSPLQWLVIGAGTMPVLLIWPFLRYYHQKTKK